ncbi:MAG: ribonuclease HII [Myxococcaceae bacterium]
MPRWERWLSASLTELETQASKPNKRLPPGLLVALAQDPRTGAQRLAEKLRQRQREQRQETQRLARLCRFERELWDTGVTHIAGVDEAGMAPLAGPVYAAAVILPQDFRPRGLDDSKKIIDPAKREQLAAQVKASAVAWAIGIAEVEDIDRLNIYHAGLLAMQRAVQALALTPQHLLVDARRVPGVAMPQRGIIHGDALSLSIAAASVIAKTERDRFMAMLDAKYPGYGFASHKGYPTPEHFARLKALGPCPIHRKSFGPVKACLLQRAPAQLTLA